MANIHFVRTSDNRTGKGLPLLPHQTWALWRENDLLTASGNISSSANYVNIHYHEDCLSCSVCGIRLKQGEASNARRYGSKVYCALHFADISGVGTGGSEFMAKLKDFKRQSLGYAEARRKSSTTLTFPIPVQACPGSPYCTDYPHGIKPTSGYWIECRRPASGAPPSMHPGEEKLEREKEMEEREAKEKENAKKTAEASLVIPFHPMSRSTSAEVFNIRGQLERQDTSKSTTNVSVGASMQPPTIQIIESQSPKSKDDIELYRRQPNIVITHHSSSNNTGPPLEPTNTELHLQSMPQSTPSVIPPVITQEVVDEPESPKPEDPYELISFQEEIYEKHYYGREHWNYFTNDEGLGPVILSLKQDTVTGRDQFRVLLRTVSYSLHGLIPASSICADRYDREAVVRALGDEAGLKPQLCLGQLPSIPDELIKLDQVFVKSELKVGVIYIKEGQTSEEAILGNRDESPAFREFLDMLGDRVRLKGFDKYKGGLDTVHDLTGTESIYTNWKNIELMFHVSTMLPHEENDQQKLQKKRHIGNDIVCVAFVEADDTPFCPGCVKSHFLHAFVVVRTSPKPLQTGEVRKYSISVACRDEVSAFKPYLWHESEFENDTHFREWLLTKIVNGERASYSAPKFARMQDRTRSQMLEDIVTNLTNHLVTGQIPKPYRRGSWRPIGHMRPSSPLLDSVRDLFECYDQLAKDFSDFSSNAKMICDVAFNVMGNAANGCHDTSVRKIYGVRAILAIRSRVFLEMLYGFTPSGTVKQPNQLTNLPGTGTEAISINKIQSPERPKPVRKSSLTASTIHKLSQIPKFINPSDSKHKRKESNISNISTHSAKTPTYLTVPGSSSLTGGIKSAFSRLVSGNWSGWGSKNRESMKRWQSESIYGRSDASGENPDIPGLSLCADVAKIDRNKLAQTEFTIIEFDGNTFQLLIEYLHSGSCPLTCDTIPGLICAAEHFDLPDLLQACFHHTKTHLRLSVVPSMLNQLENYYWRYNSATQLVNTVLKFVDLRVARFFARSEYLTLSETMISNILTRPNLDMTELRKFQVMYQWALNKVINNGEIVVSKEPLTQEKLPPNKLHELRAIMNRLTRDLQFHKIAPQNLIKIVLPSKTISHERILATLLYQADSGLYRSANYQAFGS